MPMHTQFAVASIVWLCLVPPPFRSVAAEPASENSSRTETPAVKLIEVNRIWEAAPHAAFTDLAWWNNQFVCAFREGRGHMSNDGKIRVLTSPDGASWQSAALVELADLDLRDAGLSIMPDGRLMLIGGAAPRKGDGDRSPTGTFVSFSDDARNWTSPKIILEPGRWLWRVTWHDNAAYGVAYAAPKGHPFSALMATEDGITYREIVSKLLVDGYPTEASIRFGDDTRLIASSAATARRAANSAMLGVAKPPYTEWKWHDLGIHFGGPNFIQLPSGHWIAAGRVQHPNGPKTELAWLDVGYAHAQALPRAPQRRRHELPRPRLARRPTMGELLLEP